MPVFSFGVNLAGGNLAPHFGAICSAESLRKLVQKHSVKELFVFQNADGLDVFAVAEQREQFMADFFARASKTCGLTADAMSGATFRHQGPDALRRFFRRAIGLRTSGEIRVDVQTFRDQFALARKANLVGPYFSRLYQRGLWLAEKTRIDLNLQRNAITPAFVVHDLARKIFGHLHDRTALIVASTEECEPFVRKLHSEQAGQLLFVECDDNMRRLSEAYGGRMVEEKQLVDILPAADLILVFDGQLQENLHQVKISKVMQKRHNAPLLWVSLVEPSNGGKKNSQLSNHYNVYSYDRGDLDDIVSSNVEEHQKVEVTVSRLIELEVNSFFDWVGAKEQYRFGSIIGKSEAMQKILELVARIAHSDISVLIDGESGTGKELIARAIHDHSARVKSPFITVNCGAIPETLLESELFGHVRGAFTGAASDKMGLIEAADHGTIFLDEIGETSLATQVKLLRFLQEGEVKPVGSNDTRKPDVRVITATNRHLEQMVEQATFRQDLFYRLNVIQITLPPLRDRREDILPLADFFLKKHSRQTHKSIYGLDEEVQELLIQYDWTGNVRELENAVEHAVALASGQYLSVSDLPPTVSKRSPKAETAYSGDLTLKELERRHISAMLREHDWNYDLVTEILGIGRTTLWRKMKEYGISN